MIRKGVRCVFCKCPFLRRGLIEYWRWWCDSCDRLQPDPRYPPPVPKTKAEAATQPKGE